LVRTSRAGGRPGPDGPARRAAPDRLGLAAASCAVLPGAVGLGLWGAWLPRPSQGLVDFGRTVYASPTLSLWLCGLLLATFAAVRVRLRRRRPTLVAAAVLLLDVPLAFARFSIGQHISVSEGIVENRSGAVVRDLRVQVPGDAFERRALEAGAAVRRPVRPLREGRIELRGLGAGDRPLVADAFILECCPSAFRFTIQADGRVSVATRDLR
jgi:hypothetical protein